MNLAKLIKVLPVGWSEEADAMNEAQLREVIVASSNNIRTAKEDMEDNEDFKAAKEAYKEAAAPYKEAIKAQQAKITYALHLLDSKGKL